MISVSLCMIVKNEEEVLEQCLRSVSDVCEEIIIVDTGSTDKTKEIAKKFTNKIYNFTWIDDFAAARNFAFSKATKDYIFWLDADDILPNEDRLKLKALKESFNTNIDSVSMNYILTFDEYNKPSFYFRRNRLVKRSNNFKWHGAVHEYLEVGGNILPADIAVVHRKNNKKGTEQASNRNLKIYEKRLKKGEKFTPRDLFYYANELKDHQQYNRAITYYKKFLATKKGWIEDKIRACLYVADCYRALRNEESEIEFLWKSFEFDIPRPETCCRLGDYFSKNQQFNIAIFWYETALKNKQNNPDGFHNEAFSTWYPHLSLCLCNWKIGDIQTSIKHNEIVGKMRPKDSRFLYNQQFFKKYFKKHKLDVNELKI